MRGHIVTIHGTNMNLEVFQCKNVENRAIWLFLVMFINQNVSSIIAHTKLNITET